MPARGSAIRKEEVACERALNWPTVNNPFISLHGLSELVKKVKGSDHVITDRQGNVKCKKLVIRMQLIRIC